MLIVGYLYIILILLSMSVPHPRDRTALAGVLPLRCRNIQPSGRGRSESRENSAPLCRHALPPALTLCVCCVALVDRTETRRVFESFAMSLCTGVATEALILKNVE